MTDLKETTITKDAEGENLGDLSHLVPLAKWRELNSQTLFPTPRVWEFFKQAHKAELVESGSLIIFLIKKVKRF